MIFPTCVIWTAVSVGGRGCTYRGHDGVHTLSPSCGPQRGPMCSKQRDCNDSSTADHHPDPPDPFSTRVNTACVQDPTDYLTQTSPQHCSSNSEKLHCAPFSEDRMKTESEGQGWLLEEIGFQRSKVTAAMTYLTMLTTLAQPGGSTFLLNPQRHTTIEYNYK